MGMPRSRLPPACMRPLGLHGALLLLVLTLAALTTTTTAISTFLDVSQLPQPITSERRLLVGVAVSGFSDAHFLYKQLLSYTEACEAGWEVHVVLFTYEAAWQSQRAQAEAAMFPTPGALHCLRLERSLPVAVSTTHPQGSVAHLHRPVFAALIDTYDFFLSQEHDMHVRPAHLEYWVHWKAHFDRAPPASAVPPSTKPFVPAFIRYEAVTRLPPSATPGPGAGAAGRSARGLAGPGAGLAGRSASSVAGPGVGVAGRSAIGLAGPRAGIAGRSASSAQAPAGSAPAPAQQEAGTAPTRAQMGAGKGSVPAPAQLGTGTGSARAQQGDSTAAAAAAGASSSLLRRAAGHQPTVLLHIDSPLTVVSIANTTCVAPYKSYAALYMADREIIRMASSKAAWLSDAGKTFHEFNVHHQQAWQTHYFHQVVPLSALTQAMVHHGSDKYTPEQVAASLSYHGGRRRDPRFQTSVGELQYLLAQCLGHRWDAAAALPFPYPALQGNATAVRYRDKGSWGLRGWRFEARQAPCAECAARGGGAVLDYSCLGPSLAADPLRPRSRIHVVLGCEARVPEQAIEACKGTPACNDYHVQAP